MTAATLSRGEYLKAAERQVSAIAAGVRATWGEDAADTTQSTALTDAGDAAAEAARQLGFLGLVRARDVVVVEGLWFDLEGETVAVPYDGHLGVAGTLLMLVVRSKVDPNSGTTEIEGEVLL